MKGFILRLTCSEDRHFSSLYSCRTLKRPLSRLRSSSESLSCRKYLALTPLGKLYRRVNLGVEPRNYSENSRWRSWEQLRRAESVRESVCELDSTPDNEGVGAAKERKGFTAYGTTGRDEVGEHP